MTTPLLLRSVLYMPGSNDRAIAKVRTLPADAIVLDLEDSVAPDMKAAARAAVAAALREGGFGSRNRVVRTNALGTPWGHDDLAAMQGVPLDAILVPKVDSAADVAAIAAAMRNAAIGDDVALWIMIETPLSILNLAEIAAAAKATPLAGLVLGLNDLAKDTGIAQLPGRAAFQPVLTQAVIAARAHGLAVLDGVCNAIEDEARLAAECAQARDNGFDGKTLIHPRQVDVANRVFAPTEAEVADARAVVAAIADPANATVGAIRMDGRMVERLHLKEAERCLARARAIAAAA
ncbi:CoA ester lyase [Croceicoccus sp. BE223]|uniref:HpcH/HpaI aldolase/citrate lyase family protein n=1 Tax=Croceicoccus sp. BE223 TaxID=2817716 RepID=UPI00286243B8|nr:CoA ester lyase [Croceicoccus sp. BE223]MDR7102282.1 citrate lyase subunit beta/citryl-CoA lyase [Croceicoccus sp. BE223]